MVSVASNVSRTGCRTIRQYLIFSLLLLRSCPYRTAAPEVQSRNARVQMGTSVGVCAAAALRCTTQANVSVLPPTRAYLELRAGKGYRTADHADGAVRKRPI